MMEIEIEKKKYKVKFGYRATRILADLWKCEKILEVDDIIKSFIVHINDLSFEQIDQMGDFFLSAIIAANVEVSVTREALLEVLFADALLIEKLMEDYAKSLPVQGKSVAPTQRGEK